VLVNGTSYPYNEREQFNAVVWQDGPELSCERLVFYVLTYERLA